MKKKLLKTCFCLIIGLAFVLTVGFGFYCCQQNYQQGYQDGLQARTQHIPDIFELQEMLVTQGYDIGSHGVDGRLGKDTMKAWDKASCQQYYRKTTERMKEK